MKKITSMLMLLFTVASFAQFTENFDAATTVPAGWAVLNGGDTGTWTIIDFTGGEIGAHSGTNAAGIAYGSSAHSDYLVTPSITVAAGVNDYLSFYGRSRDPLYPENIDVKISTTTPDAAGFSTTLLNAAPASGASFSKFGVDLTNYIGQTVYIGFYSSTTDMFYFDIDDVVSGPLPSCLEPSGFSAADVTTTTASLSWTGPADGNYELEYGESGFTLGTGTASTATGTFPVDLSDLAPGTTYDAYIRTACSSESFSDWAMVSFTTEEEPAANDECDGSIALTVGAAYDGAAIDATTTGATTGDMIPSCQDSVEYDVWFTVVVPSDGNLTIETGDAGTDNDDTVLVAYSGTCGDLTAIGCDDDGGTGLFSKLDLTGLEAGSTIYVQAWQYSSIFGPATPGAFRIAAYNTTLAVNQFDNSTFSYYPNPVKDVLNVSGKQNIKNVTVYNLLGQTVLSTEVGATEAKINVSSLATGNYIAKVNGDNGSRTIKLIKQ